MSTRKASNKASATKMSKHIQSQNVEKQVTFVQYSRDICDRSSGWAACSLPWRTKLPDKETGEPSAAVRFIPLVISELLAFTVIATFVATVACDASAGTQS